MSSIMTNASAMTALQSLNPPTKTSISPRPASRPATASRKLPTTPPTGRSPPRCVPTTSSLSTVQDTLGLGAGKVDTAYSGMNKAIDTSTRSRTSWSPPPARPRRQGQAPDRNHRAAGAAEDGRRRRPFSGANWLSVDTTTPAAAGTHDVAKVVSAFVRIGGGRSVDHDHRHRRQLAEALRSLRHRDGRRRRASSTVCVSAPPAPATSPPRQQLAAPLQPLTAMRSSTLTVVGFNDTQIGQMLDCHRHGDEGNDRRRRDLGAAKKRIDLQKSFTQS